MSWEGLRNSLEVIGVGRALKRASRVLERPRRVLGRREEDGDGAWDGKKKKVTHKRERFPISMVVLLVLFPYGSTAQKGW